MTDGPYTRGLSEFVAGLTFDALPLDVVERMKLLVLDTMGAGLLGAGMPWSVRMRDAVRQMEASAAASVWGTRLCLHRQLPCSTARQYMASR